MENQTLENMKRLYKVSPNTNVFVNVGEYLNLNELKEHFYFMLTNQVVMKTVARSSLEKKLEVEEKQIKMLKANGFSEDGSQKTVEMIKAKNKKIKTLLEQNKEQEVFYMPVSIWLEEKIDFLTMEEKISIEEHELLKAKLTEVESELGKALYSYARTLQEGSDLLNKILNKEESPTQSQKTKKSLKLVK